FFFSSRRRHTRFSRDWSSDVCSSDLARARRACAGRALRGAAAKHGDPVVAVPRTYLTLGGPPRGRLPVDRFGARAETVGSGGVRSEERRVGRGGRAQRSAGY